VRYSKSRHNSRRTSINITLASHNCSSSVQTDDRPTRHCKTISWKSSIIPRLNAATALHTKKDHIH
jgi:hypothetical protein